MVRKKIICSGIKPTGIPTLGNYIGALKNWQEIQDSDDFQTIYFLADLHALTVRQSAKELRQDIYESVAVILASGIDPKKSLFFIQSHVPTHAEMGWILACHTQFGELSRMTQFKDKSGENPANINGGLFTYPSLMAGDILLYNTDFVPVGEDQKQHVEITRDIASRVNNLYGNIFTIPEPKIKTLGSRVMSLQDPSKKMSKTDDNIKGFISLLDDEKTILKKFRSAVTDSEMEVSYKSGKDGINNLLEIFSVVTNKSIEEIVEKYKGKGYGDFKKDVGEAVAATIAPIREKHLLLLENKDYLNQVAKKGAEKALEISQKTLDNLYEKMGILR